jgi:hypothetical protein
VRRAAALLAFVLAAACNAAPPPSPAAPPEVELPPPPRLAFWTLDGRAADRKTIQMNQGPRHCGWESATILAIANPLGQPLTSQNSRQYIRDPEAVFADLTAGPFESSVAFPADAVFTGYRYGSMELWFSPKALPDAVFLGREGIWERWPRAVEEFGCM